MSAETESHEESSAFTESSLPIAVGSLFEMNNYDVQYDVHIHGAQVDVVATSKGDPFSRPVYIEATVEYVSTEKYGKDTTKFLLLSRKDPGCNLVCISSRGFTAPVRERAAESGVMALSYDELFTKFEKFTPYLKKILADQTLQKLSQTYEEPLFNDAKGVEMATKWLGFWKGYAPNESKWLIVLGEYGTGKTSLTKVLQLRWLQDYHSNPAAPIPIRIELRNFSRQFDANGLLHHFLDTNGLGHVPLEFMVHLIRTGRVILLLDGYDEMAQFMNSRERRACLSALAELAKDGAKGILTSRPNYFSESEELNVFESLYKKLEQQKYHLSKTDIDAIKQEQTIDGLIKRYVLERYERTLQDLTPLQTESLVQRSLQKNISGQKLVLSILNKVFREESSGNRQALSGKPVIIAYLLELVSELQKDESDISVDSLSEWQIYKLIVDRLMMRDFTRSPLSPAERRGALQRLAIQLSSRGTIVATEATFLQMIDEQFGQELRRLPSEDRRTRRIELFEDLRSSATLTRASGAKEDGWVFSHNSLREFVAAEVFVNSLLSRSPVTFDIPVSQAMRSFVSSLNSDQISVLWSILGELWPKRINDDRLGPYFLLLWDSAIHLERRYTDALKILGSDGRVVQVSNTVLRDIDFSVIQGGEFRSVNASGGSLSEVRFDRLSIAQSDFSDAIMDAVSFRDADITTSNFKGSFLFECDFSGATVTGADFRGIDTESSIITLDENENIRHLSGKSALGYLNYFGGVTSSVDDIHIYVNHPKFSVLEKICERISEQKNSQLRGLTQRGEARIDPPFARELVDRFVSWGWVTIDRNDLVSATPEGRRVLQRVVSGEAMSPEIVEFLKSRPAAKAAARTLIN